MKRGSDQGSSGVGAISVGDEVSPPLIVEGSVGPARLAYHAPPEHLRAYFGTCYMFTQSTDRYFDTTRADFAQLRFMARGTGRYHFQDGAVLTTPDVCLVGPTSGATRVDLEGESRVIGISLLPAGWLSLVEMDASQMTDRLVDLASACDGIFSEMLAHLRTLDDEDAIARCCWAFLTRLVKTLPEQTWRILEAVDSWLMGEGSPRIETLVGKTGLSPRQLARITNRYYGSPPKLLARKYRALRCSARIALDHDSWQELCDDGCFYDQSHFIREIKHFVGLTPHQLQTEPTAVAQLTLLRRSLGGDFALLNRLS